MKNPDNKDLYIGKAGIDLYQNETLKDRTLLLEERLLGGNIANTLDRVWYKSLIAVPQYLKPKDDSSFNYTLRCDSFTGVESKYNYTCNEDTKSYDFYVNMTLTNEESHEMKMKQSPDYIQSFFELNYNDAIDRLVRDGFFYEQVNSIDVSFVTYEAYYDMHALTKIKIKFNNAGEVISGVKT